MRKAPVTSLAQIQLRLSPTSWEERLAGARRREAIIQSVEATRSSGQLSLRSILANLKPEVVQHL